MNKALVLCMALLMSFQLVAQRHGISGTVSDGSDGSTMIGVNIVEKGTSNGTITDVDGDFEMTVSSRNSVLVFSMIGYKTLEVNVEGRTMIQVVMEQDDELLDEVVVVAYGSQKKVTVTGSLANVSGNEILKSPTASLGNALTGKLPGVSTVQYSGLPGADDPMILVRGVASLSTGGSTPLVMVDGVERSFTQIDPSEIADITILKDASATAVFGVQGANGVILITTRRGEAGKTQISATTSFGIQRPTMFLDYVNSYDYAMAYNQTQRGDGLLEGELRFSPEAVQHFKDGDQPILYPDMDWVSYIMRPVAPQTQQNVNISGGNEKAKYFISLGALQQGGLFRTFATDPNEKFAYDRYNYRANLDFNIDKISSLSVNIGGRLEDKSSLPRGEQSIFEDILFASPMSGAGIIDGKRIKSNTAYVGTDMDNDPMRFYGSGHQSTANNVLNLDLIYSADLNMITSGLKFQVKGSYNSTYAHTKKWEQYEAYPTYKPYMLDDGSVVLETSGDKWKPAFSEETNVWRDWYAETSLNYARKFGAHDVTALLLYNQSKYYYPWPYPEIPRGYVGVVGRATYNYLSRYLVDFNVGYNGSENFAPDKRYGLFPAISVGWIMTEEEWMKNQQAFSYLKFRYSYGIVGNDYMGGRRFLYLPPEYTIHNGFYAGYGGGFHGYNFGTNNPVFVKGATEDTSGNPEVTWETSVKQNLGVDLRTFGDRLNINIDIFKENRSNILINNDAFITAPSALVPSPINYGKVTNKGFEVVLNWTDRVGNFTYSIAPNFSFNRNKIVEMAEIRQEYDYLYRTGHRVNQPFGYEFFAFYEKDKTEQAYKDKYGVDMPTQLGQANLSNGDAIYVDLNNDGIITAEDQHAIGFPDYPEITFSLNTSFTYKKFDFSMLWNGATNVGRALSWPYNPQFGQFHDQGLVRWVYENSWTPETAATATLPRLTIANEVNNTPLSSVWLMDASYIRLRNLEIGYTFDKLKLLTANSSIRVFLNGTNLLTFSAFAGNDPENVGGGWQNTIRHPIMKIYNLGVRINF
ncbi:MAG: TonB-dependent receptor [Bacteroidota bacterium]|nr:TonB-dependent receptor [Bacteroidota bacterium]